MSLAPLLAPPPLAPAALAAAALPTDLAAALAPFLAAYLLSLTTLAMVSHLSVASHIGPADRVLRSGKRHHGERGSFHGQRGQILGLQAVYVGLPAGARHHLAFDGEAVEEVVNPFRGPIGIEALAQHRILGGHADRAASGMAVIAIDRLDGGFLLFVGLAGCP